MAIVKNGVFGTIFGKIGNIIGYSLNGKQVFRSMSRKRTKPPTFVQQGHQMRFGLVVHFLTPLNSLINKGYGNGKGKISQFNQCVAYHIKNGVKGIFPDLEIDYSKVVLTTGRLSGAHNGEVFSDGSASLNFSWIESLRSGMDGGTDNVIPVVYNPSKDRHEFLRTISDRASQCAVLNVPMEFSGDTVHCWLVFISADGKDFSTSSYLGTVTVA